MEELLRYKALVDKAMQVCVSEIVFFFVLNVDHGRDTVSLRDRRSGRWKTPRRR